MEGRAGHVAAVQAATAQIEALQSAVRLAQDRYPETLDLAIHAIGEDPATDRGRVAMETVILLALKISELEELCEIARKRMIEYGFTF
jgi:hypothetical protein